MNIDTNTMDLLARVHQQYQKKTRYLQNQFSVPKEDHTIR